MGNRVAKLGKFSPIGQLFTFGKLFKQRRSSQIFVLLYSTVKVVHSFWQKNGMGYILGEFFANSSGHPDGEAACTDRIHMGLPCAYVGDVRLSWFVM
jgi:hypothetical protein